MNLSERQAKTDGLRLVASSIDEQSAWQIAGILDALDEIEAPADETPCIDLAGMSLVEVEAALSALPDVLATSFVNQAPRPENFLERFRRLVAQGLEPCDVLLQTGRPSASSFSKGGTPSPSHHTVTPSAVTSNTSAAARPLSISQRALSSLQAKRPAPARATVRKRSGAHRRDEYDAVLAFRRLQAIPNTVPLKVDLNLSDEIIRGALASKQAPTDWLRRRILRYLAPILGPQPALMLATGIKSKGGPRLHVHAILAVPSDLIPAVGDALRAAGGEVPSRFRKRQLDARIASTAGAAVYLFENSIEAQQSGLVRGKTFVVSNLLRSKSIDQSKLTYTYEDENKSSSERNKIVERENPTCDYSLASSGANNPPLEEPTSVIATQTADTYLPAETYTNVVEALVGLAKTLHAASFDHDAIRAFLGESLNVWPQEVADDLDAERYQERIAGRFPTPTHVSLVAE